MISIVVHCIAYDKYILQCIGNKLIILIIVVLCILMKFLMISIVVHFIGIKLLMISIIVLCIAYDKHWFAMHCS